MDRKGSSLALIAAGVLSLSLLSGCSAETRQRLLSTFFDGVDTPRPPTHRVRSDLLQEIEKLKRELAEARAAALASKKEAPAEKVELPIEKAKSWEEASGLLPKDRTGHVDWVQALKAGTIAPRPGIDPRAPEQAALDLDVELQATGNKLFKVSFPHSIHTQWLTCPNCHPAVFPLQRQAPLRITMAKIQAGEYCGACHGKVAFGTEGNCVRCHAAPSGQVEWRPSEEPRKPIEKARTWAEAEKLLPKTGGMVDWSKALKEGVIAPRPGIDPKAQEQAVFPLTLELIPKAMPAMKALFPHEVHTAWLGCDSCHTALFQMKAGATPISMEKINAGQLCGACHGKVAFPAIACGRCHPAMAG